MDKNFSIAIALSLALIAGLSLGFVIGKWATPGGFEVERPDRRTQPDRPWTTRDDGATEALDRAPRSVDMATDPEGIDREGPPRTVESLILAAIDAAPRRRSEAEATMGGGAIQVSVLTESREPLGAVTVRVVEQSGGPLVMDLLGAGRSRDALAQRIKEEILEFHARASAPLVSTTNAQGEAAIVGVNENKLYTIMPELEGWQFRAVLGYADSGATPPGWEIATAGGSWRRDVYAGDAVEFTAHRVVDLNVAVRFADGGAPDIAKVYFRILGSRDWSVHQWYPGAHVIRVQPGTFELTARVGEDHALKSRNQEVRVSLDTPAPEVTLDLLARTSIVGQVRFPPGEEPERIHVHLLRRPADMAAEESLLARSRTRQLAGKPQFRFRFKDVEPGFYTLGLTRDGATFASLSDFEIHEGDTVENKFEIAPLRKDEYFVLHVFDPAGEPLRSATVVVAYLPVAEPGTRTRPPAAALQGAAPDTAIRRNDGSFWVLYPTVPVSEQTDATAPHVRVRSDRHGSIAVPVPASGGPLTIQFEDNESEQQP